MPDALSPCFKPDALVLYYNNIVGNYASNETTPVVNEIQTQYQLPTPARILSAPTL
jgi:hypothetical protein